MSINKAGLIEQIASDTKLTKTECKQVLEAFIRSIEKALKKKQSVVLTGFGAFGVMKRKARAGINPATGLKMNIPARNVPKFRAGKRLRDLVS